jgi:ribosome maturation factor RimP
MDIQHKIEELAALFLSPIDAFIVDIQFVPSEQKKIVRLFVDTDSGITIDQCAAISRQLGETLELQNIIPSPYVLEVSSPDLTKSLKLLRQYRKNVGRRFRVRFRKSGSIAEIIALLGDIKGDILTFTTDKNETYTISFNEIIESIEELPW